MAKKKTPKRKIEEVNQIDHIPKCSQQPRTPGGPKRRTDFSLFFCSSSSSLSNATYPQAESLLESPSCKDILSSITIARLDEMRDKKRQALELPLAQCSLFQDKGQGLCSDIVEVPIIEVDSDAENEVLEQWIGRNSSKQRNKLVKSLGVTPRKSQGLEANNTCRAQGSIVWAKTAHQVWWPAEVLGDMSTEIDSSYQGADGLVLIQYYGNNESAWVDPARDLSQFEDCFEERSCNPMEEFQDALKQALNQKEQIRSCRQLFGTEDGLECFNRQHQSPEKWNSSSSSKTQSDCQEKGRGKRERKPKLRFDQETFPLKSSSARKVRRFRIMRFLGLAAPVGSPY